MKPVELTKFKVTMGVHECKKMQRAECQGGKVRGGWRMVQAISV